MSQSSGSRTRLIVTLLAGSLVPVAVGKYVLPDLQWWLFGLSCFLVVAGAAVIVTGPRDGPDAS